MPKKRTLQYKKIDPAVASKEFRAQRANEADFDAFQAEINARQAKILAAENPIYRDAADTAKRTADEKRALATKLGSLVKKDKGKVDTSSQQEAWMSERLASLEQEHAAHVELLTNEHDHTRCCGTNQDGSALSAEQIEAKHEMALDQIEAAIKALG